MQILKEKNKLFFFRLFSLGILNLYASGTFRIKQTISSELALWLVKFLNWPIRELALNELFALFWMYQRHKCFWPDPQKCKKRLEILKKTLQKYVFTYFWSKSMKRGHYQYTFDKEVSRNTPVCRVGNFTRFAQERGNCFSGLALLAYQKWWFSVALLGASVRGI